VAVDVAAVLALERQQLGSGGEIHRGREQLEHHAAGVPDAVRGGAHDHPGFDGARTAGGQHARALDLDDAQPAGVGLGQRLEVAQRRHLDAELAGGLQQRRTDRNLDRVAVHLEGDVSLTGGSGRVRGPFAVVGNRGAGASPKSPNLRIADSTAA